MAVRHQAMIWTSVDHAGVYTKFSGISLAETEISLYIDI